MKLSFPRSKSLIVNGHLPSKRRWAVQDTPSERVPCILSAVQLQTAARCVPMLHPSQAWGSVEYMGVGGKWVTVIGSKSRAIFVGFDGIESSVSRGSCTNRVDTVLGEQARTATKRPQQQHVQVRREPRTLLRVSAQTSKTGRELSSSYLFSFPLIKS